MISRHDENDGTVPATADDAAMDPATLAVVDHDGDLRASLAGLSTLATSTMGLSDVLTHVAGLAVGAIPGADGAGLTLFEAGKPTTTVATAAFVDELDAIQYRIGEGPYISVAHVGRTRRSGSLGGDGQWPRFGPRAARLGVHSVLVLPLVTANGVLGALSVYAHAEDAFDDRATELGEMYAVPAAILVQNSQALSAAVVLTQQLERALANRAVIDQAIGIVMSRSGINSTDAFALLRHISQTENIKLAVVARALVDKAVDRAQSRHR